MARRVNAASIGARKGAAFPVVTAYDAPFARLAERSGIDVLLVGDSLGMVVLGYETTANVDLLDMERHAAAVARGCERAHIVADLPFGTYEPSDADAVRAAVRLVRSGATSVKLEGGERTAARVAAIVGAGIPAMGHLGVLPQTAALAAGFRRVADRDRLLADARALERAGAYAIVLEMVDAALAAEITAAVAIPTIGIGSGSACDGQVLVLHDVLGLYPDPPPFARAYARLDDAVTAALGEYARDVRERRFP